MDRERSWYLPLALGSLTLIFFAPVLFSNTALAGSDFQQIHYLLLKFVVDSVRQNHTLPLWNPHQFLGYSVIGNPQYGLFYPPNAVLLLFPGEHIYRGVALLIALHTFWASLGAALLARRWGANGLMAFLAGVLVGFGGFPAARIYAGHYAVLLTLAWLPWILWGFHLALQKRHSRWILPGAIALAMAILAGHPQFALIAGIAVIAQWGYEILTAESRASRLRVTRQLILLGIVGLILSTVTWLPVLDYASKTVRGASSDSLDFANQHAIPPRQLSTLIVPDLFGSPLENPPGYWGEPFYEEMTAYVGLLPIMLLALIIPLRRRELWLWGGLALLGIILSLGKNGGLYWLLYELLPPARSFRAPGRYLAVTSIALAIAMALIITRLNEMPIEQRRHWLFRLLRRLALPGLIMLWGGALLLHFLGDSLQDNADHTRAIITQLAISGAFLLIISALLWLWSISHRLSVQWIMLGLVLVSSADVWRMSWPLKNSDKVELSPVWQNAASFVPTVSEGEYGRVIQMLAPPGIINGASWTDHLSPQGYDPIAPEGWFRLMDKTGRFIEDPGSAVNRIFGVRYVISGQPLENYGFASAQFFERIEGDSPYYYYENDLALPRAYLVERYEVESDVERARQRITEGEVDRGDTVLLPEALRCPLSGRRGQARIIEYTPNHVTIEVQADGDGLLVFTDQYDDDWRVEVDGKRAELLQANTTTRAVCVPDGSHEIRFIYHPWTLIAGGAVSLIAWLAIIVYSLYGYKLYKTGRQKHSQKKWPMVD